MSLKSIWPIEISVVGVTGPFGSGKSLFIASIDPEHSRIYDFEKSLLSYKQLGFEHVDVHAELLKKYEKGYTPLQIFKWWRSDVLGIEPGKYSVIGVDPISDIEDGMVEWVKSRHAEWGFKTADGFVSTGGIFWNRVRSEWKLLLSDISARCQTFAFTTHLAQVWKNGKPTTQVKAKGKSTLRELSSLFLHMERAPEQLVPSANVEKTRLSITKVVDGEIMINPILPPRLPKATPKAIREYVLNPPEFGHLTDEEQYTEKELSEEDRLAIEQDIAETKRIAAETELKTEQMREKVRTAREIAMSKLVPENIAADEPDGTVDESAWTSNRLADELVERLGEDNKDVARIVYSAAKDADIDVSQFNSPVLWGSYLRRLPAEDFGVTVSRLKILIQT